MSDNLVLPSTAYWTCVRGGLPLLPFIIQKNINIKKKIYIPSPSHIIFTSMYVTSHTAHALYTTKPTYMHYYALQKKCIFLHIFFVMIGVGRRHHRHVALGLHFIGFRMFPQNKIYLQACHVYCVQRGK